MDFYRKLPILLILLPFIMEAQANYDENKVPSYSLPELLIANNGEPIKNINDWSEKRRGEILDLFEEEVYGSIPKATVKTAHWVTSVNEEALCGIATQKLVTIEISRDEQMKKIELLVYLPNNRQGATPLFLGLNFYGNHTIHTDKSIPITTSWVSNNTAFCINGNSATHLSRGVRANRWPVERILERGYGLATIYYGDIDPDFDDGFQNGIHPLFYKENQTRPDSNEWGSISAWAHGLSLAMDYFETDTEIDHRKVAVIGHSRLGKAALWAGAKDERFAVIISNNSGCGGAALSKRAFGETVKRINTSFPHWFCNNFHQYNGKEAALPIDQHMLLALMAPRPIYVASAQKDEWADPKGEFLSLFHAGSVYDLFGWEPFQKDKMPVIDQPVLVGKMGYHIRTGGHDITKYDWEKYMDFTDLHFK